MFICRIKRNGWTGCQVYGMGVKFVFAICATARCSAQIHLAGNNRVWGANAETPIVMFYTKFNGCSIDV